MSKKILIATSSFERGLNKPIQKLIELGFKIDYNDFGRKITKKELLRIIGKYDGIIAGTEKYDEELLVKAKNMFL